MKKSILIAALILTGAGATLIYGITPNRSSNSACGCCSPGSREEMVHCAADNQKVCPGSSCRCAYSDFWNNKSARPAGKDCYGKNCGQKGSCNSPKK